MDRHRADEAECRGFCAVDRKTLVTFTKSGLVLVCINICNACNNSFQEFLESLKTGAIFKYAPVYPFQSRISVFLCPSIQRIRSRGECVKLVISRTATNA